MSDRRLAILNVSPQFLIQLCKTGTRHFQVIQNALPADAVIASEGSCDYDISKDMIRVLLRSASFEEVPEGQLIPELPLPVFQDVLA